ncbi:hypothetical protein [Luteolibacter soli]|uniref:Uncharacterized protein n=1 Tax=Luteolibacter soli TaxID=3135280 RepID=A0ABU9B3B0_9BACT
MQSEALPILLPWPPFRSPDQTDSDEKLSFHEALSDIGGKIRDERLQKLNAKQESQLTPLNELEQHVVSEEAQRIIREIKPTIKPIDLNRFQLDADLATLTTEQVSVHLGDLLLCLSQRALDGDAKAVTEIAKIAADTALQLHGFEKFLPELVRELARKAVYWPILHDGPEFDESKLRERLAQLEVGEDLATWRCKFRKMRGKDADYPSRMWAKQAVRNIEETRWRIAVLSGKGLFEKDEASRRGYRFPIMPEWFYFRKLPTPPFSSENIGSWIPAVRDMIREDMPNFHEHPDWGAQRATADAEGRRGPGAVQNAILDDICSALRGLAPIIPKIAEVGAPSSVNSSEG